MFVTTRISVAFTIVMLLCSAAVAQDIHEVMFEPQPNSELLADVPYFDSLATTSPSVSHLDHQWILSSRHLTYSVNAANLDRPELRAAELDGFGNMLPLTLEELEQKLDPSRQLVVYVHGNRASCNVALDRSRRIYQSIRRCRDPSSIDWIAFSWPSTKEGCLLKDFREKADRTNAQSLYLAWFIRRQLLLGTRVTMIGYSYGGRVISGALHCLGGGSLAGRCLPGERLCNANVKVGLVAPAMGADWLAPNGYHAMSSQNMESLLLFYNSRDAVLKRYWRLERMRNSKALGYVGVKCVAARSDGSTVKVYSKNYAKFVGLRHVELDYYDAQKGNAGCQMARLIDNKF